MYERYERELRERIYVGVGLSPNLFVGPAMRDEMRGSRQKNLAFVLVHGIGIGKLYHKSR